MLSEFLKDYLPIILFLVIALGLSCAFVVLNFILSPKHPDPEKLSAYECGFEPFQDSRMEFDVRFYLVAILFIIFDLEIAFLFPWAISLGNIGLLGYLSIKWKLTNLIFNLSIASAISMIAFAMAPNDLNILLILIVMIGILQQSAFTGLYGVAAKAYPTEIRSTGVGWAIGLGRTGAVVGPALAGYLILAGYDMSANFIFFSIPMIVCGFIAYRLHVD